MSTKKLTTIGVLTAMYVVLSAFVKIPVIGNISLDLGYIAFGIACCMVGPWGITVGGIGCGLESILFSAYGFSISWMIGNIIIGFICGIAFPFVKKWYLRMGIAFIAVFLGIGIAKTLIECKLYGIPFPVKFTKNLVAFTMDSLTMCVGINFHASALKNKDLM